MHTHALTVVTEKHIGNVSDVCLAWELLGFAAAGGVDVDVAVFTLHFHGRWFLSFYKERFVAAADHGQRAVVLRQVQKVPVGL
ncbi:hypothetical protein ALQ16_203336 [Pseudomonas syringae pv. actinidiae]|nr:hypothetical protein ALQ16_203336 [Pseudomonas syringae pv. actinidiae]RMS14739.1 hypothetical protein ALP75_205335 [Pseudomonas syringae pv. actinidiae]RMS58895.1 hypothetical protein ALP64_204532 [Pseudomonas syringae pv. actinidiae]